VNGSPAPDANDQVILLQALLGAWPLELLDGDDSRQLASFHERMKGYVTKALREAKRQTSWVNPDIKYEEAALGVLQAVLDPKSGVLDRLRPLAGRISVLGMLNGLSRTILKMTLPGVPDIYQGTEFWDFSLVDPDNRRPVDYDARARALAEMPSLEALLPEWQDGRVKQYILARLLQDRASTPGPYADGDYQAIPVEGERASHVIAFMRQHGDDKLAVIVPRLWNSLSSTDCLRFDPAIWSGLSLALPDGRWRNVITGQVSTIRPGDRNWASFCPPSPLPS
jgi:(1->4)-alpha-D-glucan 1-alpha-D-glucosylmutase